EIVAIIPGYALIVFVLGGLRAWFFPPDFTIHASGPIGMTLVSLVGTLFVIPTAGEVPIVQTLLAHGMSVGAAVALIITLPAISLPSLFIVRKAFPASVMAMTFGVVFAGGLIAGTIAQLVVR
ncbi:MAG TPA: permease, partial [Candidatus Acidoferrales bacterium]|nr:permease [Candidatus Acidoferrales bacterium]